MPVRRELIFDSGCIEREREAPSTPRHLGRKLIKLPFHPPFLGGVSREETFNLNSARPGLVVQIKNDNDQISLIHCLNAQNPPTSWNRHRNEMKALKSEFYFQRFGFTVNYG